MKRNKGITLVSLIITIIILLILAAVTIKSVNGDGVIFISKRTANEYNDTRQNEESEFERYKYKLKKEQGKTWEQASDGKSVTYEKSILKVGYTVGSNGTEGVDYTVNGTLPTLEEGNQWAVLGARNGRLLLVTTKNITKNNTVQKVRFDGNNASLYKTITLKDVNGTTDLESIVINESKVNDEINTVISSTISINNTVADSIRSINVDDINRVTTYNPENVGLQHNGGYYGDNHSTKYGNTVKYEAGKAIVASNGATATTGSVCRKLGESTSSVFTVKSDFYMYYPETLTTDSDNTSELINTKWYEMLFQNTNSEDTVYWLASTDVNAFSDGAYWGVRSVYNSHVVDYYLWYSISGANGSSHGVRAVISLSPGVKIQ